MASGERSDPRAAGLSGAKPSEVRAVSVASREPRPGKYQPEPWTGRHQPEPLADERIPKPDRHITTTDHPLLEADGRHSTAAIEQSARYRTVGPLQRKPLAHPVDERPVVLGRLIRNDPIGGLD